MAVLHHVSRELIGLESHFDDEGRTIHGGRVLHGVVPVSYLVPVLDSGLDYTPGYFFNIDFNELEGMDMLMVGMERNSLEVFINTVG